MAKRSSVEKITFELSDNGRGEKLEQLCEQGGPVNNTRSQKFHGSTSHLRIPVNGGMEKEEVYEKDKRIANFEEPG